MQKDEYLDLLIQLGQVQWARLSRQRKFLKQIAKSRRISVLSNNTQKISQALQRRSRSRPTNENLKKLIGRYLFLGLKSLLWRNPEKFFDSVLAFMK